MRYISVCSGIEAASVASKACAKCGALKPLEMFHKQPKGPMGRHSYCKECANRIQKESRVRNYSSEQKSKWNRSSRYGIAPEQFEQILSRQGGVCAICGEVPSRPVMDHSHLTGKPRGVLCHRCNVKLNPVEDEQYRTAALAYLERHK